MKLHNRKESRPHNRVGGSAGK